MPISSNYPAQKRMAAKLLKCGVSRVRMSDSKEVSEALTRQDVRELIKKGLIWSVQAKGTSKAFSRYRVGQKAKGRRKSAGSKKGRAGARNVKKAEWIKRVRSLRKLAGQFREEGKINQQDYRKVYLMIKGGTFRSRKHLIVWLKDNGMIKGAKWEK